MDGATVAVKVTAWPPVDGLADEARVEDEGTLPVTVTVIGCWSERPSASVAWTWNVQLPICPADGVQLKTPVDGSEGLGVSAAPAGAPERAKVGARRSEVVALTVKVAVAPHGPDGMGLEKAPRTGPGEIFTA